MKKCLLRFVTWQPVLSVCLEPTFNSQLQKLQTTFVFYWSKFLFFIIFFKDAISCVVRVDPTQVASGYGEAYARV